MNYCNKCGDPIEINEKFCNKCGNPLQTDNNNQSVGNNSYVQNTYERNIQQNQNMYQQPVQQQVAQPMNNTQQTFQNNQNYLSSVYQNKSNNKKGLLFGFGIGAAIIFVISIGINLTKNPSSKYYFDTNVHDNQDEIVQNSGASASTKKGKYSTAIIYDNTYSGVSVNNDKEAYKLIENDSINQKNNCPSDIKTVEDEIIKKYGITAVNLCEMDINFARELGNVIKKIYDEYPGARGYLTNLSLANVSMSEGYIAAFMPVFNFATSKSSSTYPWVIKTQVLLNTSYFLNQERLLASVTDGSNAGHFPPNATIYSPVAHEFGHYLSFLAMMKYYQMNSILLVDNNNVNSFYDLYADFGKGDYSLKMINEAFENYKRDTNTTMTLDEWRGTISKYALAKDNSGNYIYDETIAESFHDVYLNGDSAKDASKYVVKVLKNKLES